MIGYVATGLDLLFVLAAFIVLLFVEHTYRVWQRYDELRRANRLTWRELQR